MRLTVIGAGPAYTDRRDASGACYLVTTDDSALLLDLGQGSLSRLFEHVEPSSLAAVLVSHLHPDHFVDLVPLRHYLRFEFSPARRMRVVAPAGLRERLDALLAEPGFTDAALDVETLAEGDLGVGDFAVQTRRVTHTSDSYAFRVTGDASGRGLVYSGDCGDADDLTPLVRRDDTLLVEASFGPGPIRPGVMHLDARAAGRLAARTGASRLLLTHVLMRVDSDATVKAARAEFDGPVELVRPGTRVEI